MFQNESLQVIRQKAEGRIGQFLQQLRKHDLEKAGFAHHYVVPNRECCVTLLKFFNASWLNSDEDQTQTIYFMQFNVTWTTAEITLGSKIYQGPSN